MSCSRVATYARTCHSRRFARWRETFRRKTCHDIRWPTSNQNVRASPASLCRFQLDRCVCVFERSSRVKGCSRRCARADNEFADNNTCIRNIFISLCDRVTRACKSQSVDVRAVSENGVVSWRWMKLPGQFAGYLCSSVSLLLRSFLFPSLSSLKFSTPLRHTGA